jgi:hypothetical protein
VEHWDGGSRQDLLWCGQQNLRVSAANRDSYAHAYSYCDGDRKPDANCDCNRHSHINCHSDFNTDVHAYSNFYAEYNSESKLQSHGYSDGHSQANAYRQTAPNAQATPHTNAALWRVTGSGRVTRAPFGALAETRTSSHATKRTSTIATRRDDRSLQNYDRVTFASAVVLT